MKRVFRSFRLFRSFARIGPVLMAAALVALAAPVARSAPVVSADEARKLYDRVTPSLVVVKYTWESELGRRELAGAGIVVGEDGLVMSTISVFDIRIPDAQMKDFKIIIPSQEKEPEEIPATFLGRDERTSLAFLRPKEAKATPESKESPEAKEDKGAKEAKEAKEDKDEKKNEKDDKKEDTNDKDSSKSSEAEKGSQSNKASEHHWKPLKFETQAVTVGEPLLSVGLLPEGASYKTYLMEGGVSATLRGEMPQVLVSGGGLAGLGSPVFTTDGKAIGLVGVQSGVAVWLNDPSNSLGSVTNPPKFFTPASDFVQSLEDPPVAGKPMELPWIGVPQMNGVNKDVAKFYGLGDKPAIEIGEVLPDTAAAKAGLKQGELIVTMNGQPLERGDEAIELPGILNRKIMRMKPGTEVTFGILHPGKKNQPPEDVKVTIEPRPPHANVAKRFYAEDLGFSVRDLTFWDTYARHLPADTKGVVVALLRPQSSAQSGGLTNNDMITQLNGQPVTDVEEFKKIYQKDRKEKPRAAVVLVVRREAREDTVRIEPPQ